MIFSVYITYPISGCVAISPADAMVYEVIPDNSYTPNCNFVPLGAYGSKPEFFIKVYSSRIAILTNTTTLITINCLLIQNICEK